MPINNPLKTEMQLTFSTKVTEDAYTGITMTGLTLNQNSSTLGTSLDTSWNRGNTPEDQPIDETTETLVAYAGVTWSAGLSGSYVRFWTPQNESFPQTSLYGTASGLLINDEPYESGGNIKFPVDISILAGATYDLPTGSSWRVFTLDDPFDDLSFGGATFTGPSLDLDQIVIPQAQISFKNPLDVVEPNGATFTNVQFANYTAKSNITPQIGLFWEDGYGGNNQWLNYDPHYFLFYYRGRKKKGGQNGRGKVPGGFMHPASVLGPIGAGVTGPTCTGVLRGYPSSSNSRSADTGPDYYVSGWRTTEWPVGLTSGNPTFITEIGGTLSYSSFHPSQYLKNIEVNQQTFPRLTAGFPLNFRYQTNDNEYVTVGVPRNQKYMYFRFAIGIFYDSPSGIRKVLFGPMSDTLRITPRAKTYGVQVDGYAQREWIINWQARLV